MKVVAIVGTRPEAIKMAPVILKLLEQRELTTQVIVTAQHREMLDQVLSAFGIRPDHDLDLMMQGQTLSSFSSRCLAALAPLLQLEQPKLVIAQGDTTTTFVSALASFYGQIDFAHVEAGLRTGNLHSPFPEEFNRVATAKLARLHFAPTKLAQDNLLREGIPIDQVLVSGNTVIDALYSMRDRLVGKMPTRVGPPRQILVTVHRRENFGSVLNRICDAIGTILDDNPTTEVVWPVHPNPTVEGPIRQRFASHPRMTLCRPLDYQSFVLAMLAADLVLTDSGGVQEEAPALGRPVVVLRSDTERPEAIAAGGAVLAGTDTANIVAITNRLLRDPAAYAEMARVRLPYGDGKAATRIVEEIVSRYK